MNSIIQTGNTIYLPMGYTGKQLKKYLKRNKKVKTDSTYIAAKVAAKNDIKQYLLTVKNK